MHGDYQSLGGLRIMKHMVATLDSFELVALVTQKPKEFSTENLETGHAAISTSSATVTEATTVSTSAGISCP